MKYADIQNLSDEQLVHTELGVERKLITARFQLYTNQLEDSSLLKKLRRDIARLQTAARERERGQGLRKNYLRDMYSPTFSANAQSDAEATADAGAAEGGEVSGGFLQGIVDKIRGND